MKGREDGGMQVGVDVGDVLKSVGGRGSEAECAGRDSSVLGAMLQTTITAYTNNSWRAASINYHD